MRSGSAIASIASIASISTILPSATVKPITVTGRPRRVTTTPRCPVHQRGAQADSRQRGREPAECLPGHGRCATDHHGGGGAPGARVEPQHDAGIEHGDEGAEIAATRCREEGVDHVPLASALEHDGAGIYNVVDDEPAPMREWLPVLATVLGAKPPRHVPRWLARLVAGEGGVMMATESRGASNAKAKRELGWTLRYPSWREGFAAAYGLPKPLKARA